MDKLSSFNIKKMALTRLKFLKSVFLFLAIISFLIYLSLPMSLADNPIHWVMLKGSGLIFFGGAVFFILMPVFFLVPGANIQHFVKHYRKQVTKRIKKSTLSSEGLAQVQEHFSYIEDIEKMLDSTPADIARKRSEVGSAESKIRAVSSASSAAIGYGAGKKTGM
jgi:hypothetical protein